ncbi:MAG: hypothetical protein RLZZ210_1076 [Pseudomonadota bacterium]|jgi:hypothetical protein
MANTCYFLFIISLIGKYKGYMTNTEIALTLLSNIFVAIISAIFALWLKDKQKVKEEYNSRKTRIFTILMTTRNARASINHVEALNMIDFAFYGFNGKENKRTETERQVLNAWREYYQHLNTNPTENLSWSNQQNDLFISLLSFISQDIGLNIPKHEIKNGSYLPRMYADIDNQQTYLRLLAIDLLDGKKSLNVNVGNSNEVPNHSK